MTSVTETPHGHVIAVTTSQWGHAKSACSLLSKIVRQRPIYATFLVGSIVAEQANKEIDSQFLSGVEDHLRRLIRVVPLEAGPNSYDFAALNEDFTKEYRKLFEDDSDDLPARGPPRLVLLDFFLYNILQCIRTVSGHEVPIYVLNASGMASLDMMFGPRGRVTRVKEELKRMTVKDENDMAEEAFKIFNRVDGKLEQIPGLPPMYDHEQMPQNPLIPKGAMVLFETVTKFLEECDGFVVNTTALLEEEAIKACREWIGKKPTICPGPFDYPIIRHPEVMDENTKDVLVFLDSMMEKYGEASIIFISLGSQFWPSEPEKLWAILDVLMDKKIPFIFAHAARSAVVPDEVKDKIKASGISYSSNWLPQTTILSHNACGWMLTHAGHNSVMEALASGVPMICWPFDADQPVSAVNVTFVHNLGYELFEVRNGVGLRPIHRLGDWSPKGTVEAVKREFFETIAKMKGEDGATKRANAQRFRDAFAELWAPGGENWKEITRITDVIQ